MNVKDLLGLVKEAFLADDSLARKQLGDVFEEHGDLRGAAWVRGPDVDRPRLDCPVCSRTLEPGEYFEHTRLEDDEVGECACEDWVCRHCQAEIATVVYRPVCFHHYQSERAGGFSEPRPIWELHDFFGEE